MCFVIHNELAVSDSQEWLKQRSGQLWVCLGLVQSLTHLVHIHCSNGQVDKAATALARTRVLCTAMQRYLQPFEKGHPLGHFKAALDDRLREVTHCSSRVALAQARRGAPVPHLQCAGEALR